MSGHHEDRELGQQQGYGMPGNPPSGHQHQQPWQQQPPWQHPSPMPQGQGGLGGWQGGTHPGTQTAYTGPGYQGGWQGGGQMGRPEEDDQEHYRHWRQQQMLRFDQDYENWREDRRRKFAREFEEWRQARQNPGSQAIGTMAGGEQDKEPK
jgi:hypothetical protein